MKVPSGNALVVPHESKPVWIVQISVILSYVGIQSPSRKTASWEKFFEMKIGILILNSDFMREICYSGKYGTWDFPIFNFENNRCFRLKKNMTIITAIHGVNRKFSRKHKYNEVISGPIVTNFKEELNISGKDPPDERFTNRDMGILEEYL